MGIKSTNAHVYIHPRAIIDIRFEITKAGDPKLGVLSWNIPYVVEAVERMGLVEKDKEEERMRERERERGREREEGGSVFCSLRRILTLLHSRHTWTGLEAMRAAPALYGSATLLCTQAHMHNTNTHMHTHMGK